MADTYQTVTDSIVRMIENGAGAWRMPWHTAAKLGGMPLELPRNPLSGTRYRGINVPLLWASAEHNGFASHHWATYRQYAERGAQVRKGERSTQIVFWKRLEGAAADDGENEGDSGKPRVRMLARCYSVFNVAQVDGFDIAAPAAPVDDPAGLPESERIALAESYFANIGATVRHGGNRAFYTTGGDFIAMPEFRQFDSAPDYYSTLGHEHVHLTGHASRCNREFGKRFGDMAYAFEELVAELGAAFLCAELQISNQPRPDHAAYIDSWLRVLKGDCRAVFTAASKAQAAVDWLNSAAATKAAPRLAA